MIGESFAYAKEAVVGKWNKWFMLIIATLILTIPLYGYILKIYRGEKPAPEVDNWGTLFVDGIKMIIIGIIYAIPLFILQFLMMGSLIGGAMMNDPSTAAAGMAGAGILFIVYIIVAIIIGLIAPIGIIRFARSGSMGEAFNFSAILATIGKIGWISYIIALIIVALVIGIPVAIIWVVLLALIFALSLVGMLIAAIVFLVIIPPIAILEARYLSQIYDSAGA